MIFAPLAIPNQIYTKLLHIPSLAKIPLISTQVIIKKWKYGLTDAQMTDMKP